MVAAYHLIWTAYGHCLPIDPRGSSSQEIRSAQIAPLGGLHFGRKQIQPAGKVIHEFHEAARGVLKHKLRTFNPPEVEVIACGFAEVIEAHNYTCYACAIMPDHVHLVIRRHRDRAEKMIAHFQEISRSALQEAIIDSEHPIWGGPGWKVFLNTREDIERTVHYVEQNPVKIRQPVQSWDFVNTYDGWLPGVGSAKPQAEAMR